VTTGIPTAPPGTGIIVPRVPFVFPDGTLTPISWRFLLGMWKTIGDQSAKAAPASATHTGTSTTDGSGNFTASWPAFSSVFMGLTISTTDPVYPGGIVAPTTITLGSYTGTLSTTDNLYPTPTTVVQAGVTFGWIVSGY
jgi:hypothetical protein